ncbi:Uu.00g039880.m01.CDS01 [Anthostomella pinea]|uniref:Uu.00g039880.m01.CDS01 n=1 Tax=Anthostomella pinea TaxID=933095 RepID=A0AAI8YDV5_9PEZI|nr:Uu.00g039880.m01.CDS01 [Anthostomella pinea]
MAGLVAYESSDEEQDVTPAVAQLKPLKPTQGVPADAGERPDPIKEPAAPPAKADAQPAVYGPQMGPAAGPSFPPLEEDTANDDDDAAAATAPGQVPSGSPYSANRALLRDLTLPTLPNMDIPPSPPGSPPPETSKKFEHFLELKKQGVHFNSRIAQPQQPAMRNPALMDKLLGFVGLDQRDQYATTLPVDVFDPAGFSRWAYKEQLKQSQVEVAQARARGKGAPVEFVAASGTAAGQGDAPLLVPAEEAPAAGKRKTRFDT